jgi:hypothetical protein
MPYVYPQSSVLFEIEQDLIQEGRAGRLGLDLMPDVNRNAAKVRWTQKDNYYGLQQMRGYDGSPLHVTRVKQTTYEYNPGVFGEFTALDEQELTTRAGAVDLSAVPVDIGDLIAESQRQLIGREFDRMESSIWTLLSTGVLNITKDGPNGKQVTYKDSYTTQTYTATVPWATSATATPIKDFQAVQQLGMAAGHSVNFGSGARAICNGVTGFRLLNNSNAADYGGRRSQYGATINSLKMANDYFGGQNLPQLEVYDRGYIPRIGGTFKKFIPDGVVIVIGQRPSGAKIGEYQMTRNLSNNLKPGSYSIVKDYANGVNAPKEVPGKIEVHRGHNGGPAIYYPSAVVVMSV